MGKSQFTKKQQAFIREYPIDFNGAAAAVRAGYSKNGSRVTASQLLANPNIQEALEKVMQKRVERIEVKAQDVLEEVRRIAFANAGDYFEWGPDGIRLKPSDRLTPEQRAAVGGVSETISKDGGTINLRFHNKNHALEMLMKHFGLMIDRREISGPGGGPIQTLDLSHLSDEELQTLEPILAKFTPRPDAGGGEG